MAQIGLASLLDNIADRLRRKDVDEDQISAILSSIRAQRQHPGSQLGQFLDFLDDEALSRVRVPRADAHHASRFPAWR